MAPRTEEVEQRREQLPRTSYLQDVGKGREHDCMDAGGRVTPGAVTEERKLEGSPSSGSGTNCPLGRNAKTIAKLMIQPDIQRTRAICGLKLYPFHHLA